jgi:hypothetical protein
MDQDAVPGGEFEQGLAAWHLSVQDHAPELRKRQT